jgi:hypothetical protein
LDKISPLQAQVYYELVKKAVNTEYKGDYASLQFRIIYHELEVNKNPLADLFIPEIEKYKWVGIFYTEREYHAFKQGFHN